MSEKYIQKRKNSYGIIRNSRVFASAGTLEDAIFLRDLLSGKDWNLDNFTLEMHLSHDKHVAVAKIDERLHLLGKFDTKPNDDDLERIIKKIRRNPNNSKYGLNISRVFEIFMVKKQIAGEEHIFGLFDNLEDAKFTRNFLLDNSWNVNAFGQIEFCDETNTYKTVFVFDDMVYVLGTFDSFEDGEANMKNCRKNFLNKIYKHKNGLANHPHLDGLTDHLDELEGIFQVKTSDETWQVRGDVADPLTDIVFNLTPWQKIIYDNAGETFTFEEVRNSLKRYRSKNFDEKINRHLDELVQLGLIEKLDDGNFKKT
ncbi:hypothetical protein [Methanobrevibacter sp.]|uniref:hypothetical protein n=1 Tax=Methanobrevibacter sp. TaxID=66852 RepID=UPI00388DF0C1